MEYLLSFSKINLQVNVLTHTNSAEHTSTKSNKADTAKRNTGVQDEDLAYDTMEGGAMWDIFRR